MTIVEKQQITFLLIQFREILRNQKIQSIEVDRLMEAIEIFIGRLNNYEDISNQEYRKLLSELYSIVFSLAKNNELYSNLTPIFKSLMDSGGTTSIGPSPENDEI